MKSIDSLCEIFPNRMMILDAVIKTDDHLSSGEKIMVSVSGGSDSDVVVDMVEKIGYKPGQVIYVWFDTGLEYTATKQHLDFLEQKYGITIERHRAKKPIPISCRQYGQPFFSKTVAMYIGRLQKYEFKWEDRPYSELVQEYPRCQSALKWWCNEWGENSRFNIDRMAPRLKEFMVQNPPKFNISDKCCQYAKKNVAYELEKNTGAMLSFVGVRRAEGGIRALRYSSCYTPAKKNIAQFRPIFWFTDEDKEEYETHCGVQHSLCYTEYGLKRTGCAGCPFGSRFEDELEIIRQYEPKLYKAVNNIFGESYAYARKFRAFKGENQ